MSIKGETVVGINIHSRITFGLEVVFLVLA